MATITPQERAETRLPTPTDRPNADVVIYDGQCKFCQANVAIFARLDRGQRLAFISLHDPEVYERWPDLSHDDLMREMVIVDRQGHKHVGAGSIRYLSRRVPLMWPLALPLHIPFSMPLWRWLYRQVAQRRYLIGGKRIECDEDGCKMHFS